MITGAPFVRAAPIAASTSVSARTNSSGVSAPMRCARSLTCAVDSSPVMYSTLVPEAASLAATLSSKVDLPTPGSPASRRHEPGTSPPPRTTSSSLIPVGRRIPASWGRSVTGTARDGSSWRRPAFCRRSPSSERRARPARGRPGDSGSARRTSTRDPHWPHSGQRPSQRGVSYPHSWHTNLLWPLGKTAPPLGWPRRG